MKASLQADSAAGRLSRAVREVKEGGAAVAILDESGIGVGRLRGVVPTDADNSDFCERLTRWRRAARDNFLTQFEESPERTRSWLRNVVAADASKILFVVEEASGRPVGNIGLCGVREDEAEIDNVLRGEQAAPGTMRLAAAALVRWAFERLAIERLHLRVFSHNARAIRLYHSLGFHEDGRTPLVRRATSDEVRYFEASADDRETVDFSLVHMRLNRGG